MNKSKSLNFYKWNLAYCVNTKLLRSEVVGSEYSSIRVVGKDKKRKKKNDSIFSTLCDISNVL